MSSESTSSLRDLSQDYANYLVNTNINREIGPIRNNLEELILRLEEMESMMRMIHNECGVTRQELPRMTGFKAELKEICQRVDSFEDLITIINKNLVLMEQHVETAASDLGYSESGLMGLLKPLFKDPRKNGEAAPTNLDAQQKYIPCPVFKAAKYFSDSSSC